jgi:hypothetical protein
MWLIYVMYLGPYCIVICLLLWLLVDYSNFDVLWQVLYLLALALYGCSGTFNKYKYKHKYHQCRINNAFQRSSNMLSPFLVSRPATSVVICTLNSTADLRWSPWEMRNFLTPVTPGNQNRSQIFKRELQLLHLKMIICTQIKVTNKTLTVIQWQYSFA